MGRPTYHHSTTVVVPLPEVAPGGTPAFDACIVTHFQLDYILPFRNNVSEHVYTDV